MTKILVRQGDHPDEATSVRILPDDVTLAVLPGESIVEAVRRNGLRTRYLCRRGGCGACKADLVDGAVAYTCAIAGTVLSDAEVTDGKCLPCRARPVGEATIRLSEKDCLRAVFGSIPTTGAHAGDNGEKK